MKKYFALLLGAIAIFYITGCSTDFNVAAPYKNYTIVYGLLDMKDTAHYIRIEKAFLDQTKSAIDMAKVADSNYYPQLDVVIRAINDNAIMQTIPLTKVDLTTEGYPKDSGVFFTSPNYAYKFKAALNPAYQYRLVISNASLGIADSAITYIIDDSNDGVFAALSGATTLDFANPNINTNIYSKYNYPDNQPSAAAAILQGFIRFRWVDSSFSGSVFHQADLDLGTTSISQGSNNGRNNSGMFVISNSSIYSFLHSALGDANGASRYFDSCDVIVYAGSSDFSTYNQRIGLEGTGIAGSEIQPVYTNLKGSNVLGLFTNRGAISSRAGLTNNTINTLIALSDTGVLKGTNIKGLR